ncbi:MAG: 2Fe-2S iron-sulfur cluster-binding protein [Leptothrix sp. (in: b-proteobacteria)]
MGRSLGLARGRWRITLSRDGEVFEAAPDTDLITAARAAGLRLASSCRNGTCRTCRCRLLEGTVVHRIEWPGLSREELAEGWILPCVALARSALSLDTAAMAVRRHPEGGSG